jgi:hypothetical protein
MDIFVTSKRGQLQASWLYFQYSLEGRLNKPALNTTEYGL